MSLQTVEINSVKIVFDKGRTNEYRTDFNRPCDCQNCRNYYKHIENNLELVDFLSGFGIDYNCTEEVSSWDWGNDKDTLIHHEGYYGVFGKIEGEEFDFERFGVKIAFQKGASVPCDRTGEYFWICVEGDFPYILDEERDLPITFSQKIQRSNIICRIKAIFKKMQLEYVDRNYKEHRGILVRKYRSVLRKYVFVIDENGEQSKVYVGKCIYEDTKLGSKVTVGEINRKLVNIRPGICKNNDE